MSRKSEAELLREDELIRDAWMGVDKTHEEIFNPLENIPENYFSNPHVYILWLLSNPEYFALFCREVLNITIHPIQCVILKELWTKKFPMLIGTRAMGKTFILALYNILRLTFIPGRKIVMTGAGFRQSKLIFEYMEKIWDNAPVLRDLAGPNSGYSHGNDAFKFTIGESVAYALPIGDGSKIRGYRAHDIEVDEFAVGNPEILEHVIFGFAAVSADPIGNVKRRASEKEAKKFGRHVDENQETYKANQIILSGTAYYEFNHSYTYWRKYQAIINSGGDKKKLLECGADPKNTNPDDYSIMRIPYYFMPEGFMEVDIITRAKNNMHESLFLMEYMGCFSNDSNGFFKRSLLEKCVGDFDIALYGDSKKEYVLGIDPASESDNFCIVLLEISKHIRKVVYCWTSTKQSYKAELKSGRAKENDFYDYACRKILDLVNAFNIVAIAIDSQGGGHAIVGRLHNPLIINAEKGEVPLWPVIDEDKPSEDDIAEGRHIIELISFADAEWTSSANHGMRLDFESRVLLFPKFDGLTFAEIDLSNELEVQNCDITEEAVLEIEEMKNELSSIVMSQTTSGRDRWDTPDQKLPGQKKGRLRKDRYSSLLMANYIGKKVVQDIRTIEYSTDGGVAKPIKSEEIGPIGYIGTNAVAARIAKQLTELYS